MFLQGFIYIFYSESKLSKVQLKENRASLPSALGSCIASPLSAEVLGQHLCVKTIVEVAVDLLRLLWTDLGTSGDVQRGAVRDTSRRAPYLQLFGVQWVTLGQQGKLAVGQKCPV